MRNPLRAGLLCLAFQAAVIAEDPAGDVAPYEDPFCGFRIDCPRGWAVLYQADGSVTVEEDRFGGASVNVAPFRSPSEGATDARSLLATIAERLDDTVDETFEDGETGEATDLPGGATAIDFRGRWAGVPWEGQVRAEPREGGGMLITLSAPQDAYGGLKPLLLSVARSLKPGHRAGLAVSRCWPTTPWMPGFLVGVPDGWTLDTSTYDDTRAYFTVRRDAKTWVQFAWKVRAADSDASALMDDLLGEVKAATPSVEVHDRVEFPDVADVGCPGIEDMRDATLSVSSVRLAWEKDGTPMRGMVECRFWHPMPFLRAAPSMIIPSSPDQKGFGLVIARSASREGCRQAFSTMSRIAESFVRLPGLMEARAKAERWQMVNATVTRIREMEYQQRAEEMEALYRQGKRWARIFGGGDLGWDPKDGKAIEFPIGGPRDDYGRPIHPDRPGDHLDPLPQGYFE